MPLTTEEKNVIKTHLTNKKFDEFILFYKNSMSDKKQSIRDFTSHYYTGKDIPAYRSYSERCAIRKKRLDKKNDDGDTILKLTLDKNNLKLLRETILNSYVEYYLNSCNFKNFIDWYADDNTVTDDDAAFVREKIESYYQSSPKELFYQDSDDLRLLDYAKNNHLLLQGALEKIEEEYLKLRDASGFNEDIQIAKQALTQLRFFDRAKNRNPQTHHWKAKFELARTSVEHNPAGTIFQPSVDNIPFRRLITAEIGTLRDRQAGVNWNTPTYNGCCNYEVIKFGRAKYKYRHVSYGNNYHAGNFKADSIGDTNLYPHDLGTYQDISNRLNAISGNNQESENESEIATLLLSAMKNGMPITETELNNSNLPLIIPNYGGATDIFLSALVYHSGVKEIARYGHPPIDTEELYLPLALAQFRALKLVKVGKLKLNEVFGTDSTHGVFTGKEIARKINANGISGNGEKTIEKIKRINHDYAQRFFDIGKVHQYKSELAEAYGGDTDSISSEFSYGSIDGLKKEYTNPDPSTRSKVNYKIPGL